MRRTPRRPALSCAFALVAGILVLLPATATAHEGHDHDEPGAPVENSIEAAARAAAADEPAPQGVTLPAGFADVKVIGNITEATAVDFAPDGTAFVALKTGVIKSFDYNSGSDKFEPNSTSTNFADLSTNVNNYWDRGLTGITLDPQFGTAGHNYVYVNYTYNRDPRDNPPVVPKWGEAGQQYDVCPQDATTNPPFAGCAVMMRVTRLTAVKNSLGWEMVPGSEFELLAGGCFQFGSHASGDVVFGPDGKLYASAGEGASFDTQDYGQYANPCGDPTNEGGSLRSQDYRTSSDPLGVDGTIVRLNPAAALTPTQATANQWLVAYGQRNPWRLAVRPGTQELWSGDVGGSNWEEVNRIPDVNTVTTPINRGWPCYEGTYTGSEVQEGWDALDRPICENLYLQGASAVSAPYFGYRTRGPKLTGDTEDCANSTSSVSGVSFGSASSNYPAAYKGAMFFSDFARACVWVLGKKPNGDPDPANIQRFLQAAETPVGLESGPGGDLYYVDYGLGEDQAPTEGDAGIHRVVYTGSNATPTARITSDKDSGPAPLAVQFDGTESSDPDADALTYAWDLDGDGAYDDSTVAKPTWTYSTVGTYTVGLRVDDQHGHTATTTKSIQAGNTAPVLGTVTPTAALTWKVGDTISFSAAASDTQQGAMPASAFSWTLAIRHCPTGNCHTHPLQTYPGVSSGSFTAPDHEYPSHLLLTVTVTDSGGLTDTRTVQLDPKTVTLSFASSPSAATVTVNGTDHAAPYNETFIQGSRLTVTAAPAHVAGGANHAFGSWSDGGARSHELSAPTTATSYTATYARQNRNPVAAITTNPSPATGAAPLNVSFSAATSSDPDGDDTLTYAWDLDGNGTYETAGVSQTRTYPVGAVTVGLKVTDAFGGSSTTSVPVTATNSGPTITSITPAAGTTWSVGQTINVAATATDPQETLGDSAYSWLIERQDCETGCARSTVATISSQTGSFAVPQMPYPSHLFLTVTVTDSQGTSTTQTRQLEPKTAALTFATTPTAGSLTVAGTARTAPHTQTFVQGASVAVAAPSTRAVNGANYAFASWSDGGAAAHTITVPAAATTYTAAYARQNRVPTARIATNPSPASGVAPLAVSFDGSTSTDPDGDDTLSYAWDLDGNGSYETTGATASRSYPVGTVTVGLRVMDAFGGSSTASVPVTASNSAPTITSMAPAAGTTWSVGQLIDVAATATDPQQTLPDSAYAWTVERQDCATGCPRTVVATIPTRSGSFTVPEMPYPSHLYVSVSVTDSQNQTTAQSRQLEPKTVALQFATAPAAGTVTVGGIDRTPTWTQTFVPGAHVAVSVPENRTVDGANHGFASWSDGGARSHTITVPATATTFTATYTRQNRVPVAVIATDPPNGTGSAPLTVSFDASGSSDPDTEPLTYAWDLDGDGQYDDGTAATATATYRVGTVTVGLRATDGHGGSGTTTATVTSTNTAPTVSGVGVYPDATFIVDQTLGFDATATDPQQELPDSAYSFVMERQPCDTGCPRQVLQRWTGVKLGQFKVPVMPWPSHLYLTVTVTDAQGATGTRAVRIDPRTVSLTVGSKKAKVKIGVDGVDRANGWSGQFVIGSSVPLVAPKRHVKKGVRYVFVRWTDGGARKHVVRIGEQPLDVRAVYRKVR